MMIVMTANLTNKVNQTVSEKVSEKVTEYQMITAAAQDMLSSFLARVPYLVVAFVVFMIFWLLSIVFKKVVTKFLGRHKNHQNLITVFRRVGGALILFFGFMVAMLIAVPSFTPSKLIGAMGIGSVAIGFAFKDIFQNLLSGILLLLSEPFVIGDQIISGEFEGTVEDIQIRATTIKTYDGRRVVIPNSKLYTSAMTVNTAYSQRRLEIALGISYDADIDHAKQVILSALSECQTVSKLAEPSVIATEFGDFSINLKVRWFIDEGTQVNRVASIHEVIVKVKTFLDNENIGIPYPTTTLDIDKDFMINRQKHKSVENI